jgi:hypothetical protein
MRNVRREARARRAAKVETTTDDESIPGMAREDELDDHNYQVREVYAQFGLTVYLAQVLEKGVVNAVTLAEAIDQHDVRPSVPFPDLYDTLEAANARLPLGPLLKKFGRYVSEDPALLGSLTGALERRNHLAHHFFWDHANDMMSAAGREEMLAELLLLAEQMHQTDQLVTPVVRRQLRDIGWTDEAFDRAIDDSLQRMHARAVAREGS